MHILALDVGTWHVEAAVLDVETAAPVEPKARVAYETDHPTKGSSRSLGPHLNPAVGQTPTRLPGVQVAALAGLPARANRASRQEKCARRFSAEAGLPPRRWHSAMDHPRSGFPRSSWIAFCFSACKNFSFSTSSKS